MKEIMGEIENNFGVESLKEELKRYINEKISNINS